MSKNKLNYQIDLVDTAVYQRFPKRMTVFKRRHTDVEAPFYHQSPDTVALEKAKIGALGYSRVEAAMESAAWTVAEHFDGAYSQQALGDPHFMLNELGQYQIDDLLDISQQVKNAAVIYGAALVGISAFDRRWLYQVDGNTIEGDLVGMKFAVTMAVKMDAGAILESPKLLASAATGAGYSQMAVVASSVAQFIRHLGYRAIAMGNDTALSIPIAVDAGLGQLGRNGLLITKEYGPCVRLCKVFTDIPLIPDKPAGTGLYNYCRQCKRCASACKVGAISFDSEPSYQVVCASNNPGLKRWAINADRCYQFWIQNGSDCSMCIAACPFTRRAVQKQSAF